MAALALNDSAAARVPYESLLRSSGQLARFSTDRVLGLLAAFVRDPDTAAGHFEDALVFTRASGYLRELAWTCFDYAEMLLDRTSTGSARDVSGDREKVIELQDEALAITRELGMRPLTERILARRDILRA